MSAAPPRLIRAFIAIELSAAVRARLDDLQTRLRAELEPLPLRWVAAANLHLTLKFLGEAAPTTLKQVEGPLAAAAAQIAPFALGLGGLGAFPSRQRARVVWIGVAGPPELAALARSLDEATARLGFPREERPFSPHLTLARVGRDLSREGAAQLAQILTGPVALAAAELGTSPAAAVTLFQSDLGPAGPRYTPLFSAPFSSL
jgi:2'-5' RNA ligase